MTQTHNYDSQTHNCIINKRSFELLCVYIQVGLSDIAVTVTKFDKVTLTKFAAQHLQRLVYGLRYVKHQQK